MEVLRERPNAASFTPLTEHQSATPASFYSGPPILHYHSDRSKVLVLPRDIHNAPGIAPLFQSRQSTAGEGTNGIVHTNGDAEVQKVAEEVDVWVTSQTLLLYSSAVNAGVSIPYPSISLHAIQTLPTPTPDSPEQGVYMQLVTSNNETPDDLEPESISLTIIPTASAPPTASSQLDAELETEDTPEQTPVQALFNALSDCANLHPDPINDDDDEEGGSRLISSGLAIPGDSSGGLPPPMPGSGGWITSENMHEFIDEDGNWIQQDGDDPSEEATADSLGPGAGIIREREDDQTDADDPDNGETKWQRTS